MRKIDFFSFKDAPSELRHEWSDAVERVINSGQFIGGPSVTKFEIEWAEYLGISNAIGLGNGYDALFVALKVLNIGRGDIVAVPSHTFIATWLAVGATGATPIGIDCDSSGLMDISILENWKEEIAAVIPVHMHGQMVDMPRLMAWAKSRNVKVVEDCAQAHGAEILGRKAGTWGDLGAFSFYPTKNLGALGDGGALVTNDSTLADKVRSFANYGSFPQNKYSYQYQGINSRLDPIQAAVLSVNLKYLDSWNSSRIKLANHYFLGLKKLSVKPLPAMSESVFHHLVVLSDKRDESRKALSDAGISTEIHYPECAQLSFQKFSKVDINGVCDAAKNLSNLSLSLPISPWLSFADVDYILGVISEESILRTFL